jgi:hypothetical protein
MGVFMCMGVRVRVCMSVRFCFDFTVVPRVIGWLRLLTLGIK